MVTDPEVRRFLLAGPVPTIEVAQRIIGERQTMERELGHAMRAVEDKTTGTFVGQCGLRPVDEGAIAVTRRAARPCQLRMCIRGDRAVQDRVLAPAIPDGCQSALTPVGRRRRSGHPCP